MIVLITIYVVLYIFGNGVCDMDLALILAMSVFITAGYGYDYANY